MILRNICHYLGGPKHSFTGSCKNNVVVLGTKLKV